MLGHEESGINLPVILISSFDIHVEPNPEASLLDTFCKVDYALKLINIHLTFGLVHFLLQLLAFALGHIVVLNVDVLQFADVGEDYLIEEFLDAIICEEVHSEAE